MKRIRLIVMFAILAINQIAQAQYDPFLKINVNLGENLNTYINTATMFNVYASSLLGNYIVSYEWDMNGDDVTDITTTVPQVSYNYSSIGTYRVKVVVHDNQANSSYSCLNVIVNQGVGTPSKIPHQYIQTTLPTLKPGDGLYKTYAVLFCGSSDYWFWPQVDSIYSTLKNNYLIPSDRIILLYWNGLNPQGQNPNGMIYNKATSENLQNALNSLSTIIDADDKLFVWVNSHGAEIGRAHV